MRYHHSHTLFHLLSTIWTLSGLSTALSEQIQTCSVEEGTCSNNDTPPSCVDLDPRCARWSYNGACDKNAGYMADNCRKSCDFCHFIDSDSTLGVPQLINGNLLSTGESKLQEAREYLNNVVANDPKLQHLLPKCRNHSPMCTYYALTRVCHSNPNWTRRKCAPVCASCEYLSVDTLCPYDPDTMPSIWKPGDVNRFFTNLTTLPQYQKYEPRVLSRPDYLPGDTNETASYQIGPYVVVLENIMTVEEAERMIELGAVEGYQRSADSGALNDDGPFSSHYHGGRTSSNAWCQNACYSDPVAQRILQRVTDITNIPQENSEYWQLLRYEKGQSYQIHHDYGAEQKDRAQGVRILTFFLYLNDMEEDAGGGTNFPQLNITVQPKRGRALLWPSVLDENPDEVDPRTEHQARFSPWLCHSSRQGTTNEATKTRTTEDARPS